MRFKVNSDNRAECLDAILGMTDDKGKLMFPARCSGGNEVVMDCPICGKRKLYADRMTGNMHCFIDGKTYPDLFLKDALSISQYEAEQLLGSLLGIVKADVSYERKETSFKDISQDIPIANDLVLNKVYHEILTGIKEMMRGPRLKKIDLESLLARGFTEEEVEKLLYTSFWRANVFKPSDKKYVLQETSKIATRLKKEYLGDQLGVPGIEQDKYKTDKANLHQPAACSIMMPARDRHYRITRLMLRKSVVEDDMIGGAKDVPKCLWFTSGGHPGGCKAVSTVHYACAWKKEGETYDDIYPVFKDGIAYITEGFMKADLAHCIKPEYCFLAIPGVNHIKPLKEELEWLKENGRIKKVVVAFDMDYQENEHVKKAMAKLGDLLKELEIPASFLKWERFQDGEDLKGIDDLLAYTERGIKPSNRKH